jgi:hypothetical protein
VDVLLVNLVDTVERWNGRTRGEMSLISVANTNDLCSLSLVSDSERSGGVAKTWDEDVAYHTRLHILS